jgi:hypothetical protein
MITRGAMRMFPLLYCIFSAAAVQGRTQVRGASEHDGRRRLPKQHNPFVDKSPPAPANKSVQRSDPKNSIEHMTFQLDPVMYELDPDQPYDPDYIDLIQQADNFNGMPPDLYMQEHEALGEEAEAEAHKYTTRAKGSGSKGGYAKSGGAYKADYEYVPGSAKNGKGHSKSDYDDDYYYNNDCDEDDEDEEYEEYDEEYEDEPENEEEYDYDDDYYKDSEMSYPGKGKGKDHGKGSGKGRGKGSTKGYESGKGSGKGRGKGSTKGYESEDDGDGHGDGDGKGKGKGGDKSGSYDGKGKGKGYGAKNSKKGGKGGCNSRSPRKYSYFNLHYKERPNTHRYSADYSPVNSPRPAGSSDDGKYTQPIIDGFCGNGYLIRSALNQVVTGPQQL